MEENKELSGMDMANISLKLNSYEDIFSSFDPRPASERGISVDFLEEARRAAIDKHSDKIELRLLLPGKLRKKELENIIRKRLWNHFDKHAKLMKKKYRKIIYMGISFIIAGMILMALATYILFRYSQQGMLTHFLLVLFEPAGWFFFWEGLNQIIFESKHEKPLLEFYQKMNKSVILFFSY